MSEQATNEHIARQLDEVLRRIAEVEKVQARLAADVRKLATRSAG